MSEVATLSSLIQGKEIPVSFRHLSSVLKIPTRSAQKILSDYASSQSTTVTILWCVTTLDKKTGRTRTYLTTETPSSQVSKQVWAVGPKSIANATSPSVWLQPDANREKELVKKPSHEQNELRDGRWNVIRSTTSSWDDKPDPRIKDMPTTNGHSKPSNISLLSAAKARMKTKDSKKRAKGGSLDAFQKSPKEGAPAKKPAPAGSLFASKPLGMDSAAKIKKEERKEMGRKSSNGKNTDNGDSLKKKALNGRTKNKTKSRRVVEEEDEEKAEPKLDDEDEIDEEQKRIESLEKEEAEREEAERAAREAEKAELAKEVAELTNNYSVEDEEEPDDAELMKTEEKTEGSPGKRKGSTVNEPDNGKRFRETFGVKEPAPGSKRIRKEVEETVEGPDGYLTTTRVIKWFDEEGNEVSDPGYKESPKQKAEKESNFADKFASFNKKQSQTPSKSRSSEKKKKNDGGSGKRPGSKQSNSSANKKGSKNGKGKGNILSYFGKKQ